jgi:outer membrane protein OmpA-like peptidoglycan-associated protein
MQSGNNAAAAPTVTSTAAPASKSRNSLVKAVIVVVTVFVLFLILVMGSCAYIAYRAKQRINKVEEAYQKNDPAGMLAAATGQTTTPESLPGWKPAPQKLVAAPSSKVPLRESLRLIDAGTDKLRGDFESIFVVDKVTEQLVHIKSSQQFPNPQGIERLLENGKADSKTRKIECGRGVFTADLESSAEFDGYLCREGRDERHPGTTALGLSRKTFNELKGTGQSDITYHEDPVKSLFKSFKNVMSSDSNEGSDKASQDLVKKMMSFAPGGIGNSSAMDTPALKATLRRTSAADLAFPVLINDQPAELPVMDIVVKVPDNEAHVYVLDDADNPLVLAAASKDGGHEQIIKIYWDTPKAPSNQLERELEKEGRVKVYDLYFDFASDTLRPESDRVLNEIAEAMSQHLDWKLSVEGHTDNIGGDASNLELSKRRSAAVVQALVAKYHIPATRFTTAGFGSSRPLDTNDTLEGRARNRRVELVRQ